MKAIHLFVLCFLPFYAFAQDILCPTNPTGPAPDYICDDTCMLNGQAGYCFPFDIGNLNPWMHPVACDCILNGSNGNFIPNLCKITMTNGIPDCVDIDSMCIIRDGTCDFVNLPQGRACLCIFRGEYLATNNRINNSFSTGYIKTDNGNNVIAIDRFNQNNQLLWTKTYGETGQNRGHGISTDYLGNSIVTGQMQNTVEFDETSLTAFGSKDIFVVKNYDDGNQVWAKHYGSAGEDVGKDIVVDNVGNSYLTGWYSGDAYFDQISLANQGTGADAFIAKVNSNGVLVWAKKIGTSADDKGHSIAYDVLTSSIFATGYFTGFLDFGNGITLDSPNGSSMFIAKYNTDGEIIWAREHLNAIGQAITVDNVGNCIAIGQLADQMLLVKYSAGGALVAEETFSGSGYIHPKDITHKSNGSFIVIGNFTETMQIGTETLSSAGSQDIFRAEFNANFLLKEAIREGGPDLDYGLGIDNSGEGYTSFVGCTFGTSTVGGIEQTGDNLPFSRRLNDEGTTVGINTPKLAGLLGISPNPFTSQISIEFDNKQAGNFKVQLIDLLGRTRHIEQYHASIGRHTKHIILDENLPKGIYLLQITDETGRQHTEKLLH